WAAGGIGPHSAAGAIAAGAAGVVLDAQLALVTEADLPDDVADAIRAMDGSETTILAGHRLYTRPDLPVASLEADLPALAAPATKAATGVAANGAARADGTTAADAAAATSATDGASAAKAAASAAGQDSSAAADAAPDAETAAAATATGAGATET